MNEIEKLEERERKTSHGVEALFRKEGESEEAYARRLSAEKNARRCVRREKGESLADYARRFKRERRQAFLLKKIPDRKCKLCGETKLKSRSWVIVTKQHLYRVAALVEARRVSLEDYAKLRAAGACCLTCWRTKFSVPPNKRGVDRATYHQVSQRDALLGVLKVKDKQRRRSKSRKKTGVGSHADVVASEALGER
jgi:hypothetical protein